MADVNDAPRQKEFRPKTPQKFIPLCGHHPSRSHQPTGDDINRSTPESPALFCAVSRSSVNPSINVENIPKLSKQTGVPITYHSADILILKARRSPPPLHSEMADVNSVPHNFRTSAEDPRVFSAAE